MAINAIENVVKQLQEERLDVPNISQSAIQFLHVLFNASYAEKMGAMSLLKQQGYSDAFIAGFIKGLQYCSDTLDSAIAMRRELKDTVQFD